jgi:hypothetical protein
VFGPAVSEVQTYTTTVSNGNGNGASAAPITVEVNVPAVSDVRRHLDRVCVVWVCGVDKGGWQEW